MIAASDFRATKLPLSHGAGLMPALGFGTLIADRAETISATINALAAGFRHFDCAERYRNEGEVGEAIAGRTCRSRNRARRHLCYHKIMEHEPSARARGTGIRGEPEQTPAQLSGSVPHSHSFCISARGGAGSPRSERKRPVRPRSDFARYLEGDGESSGPWQMPSHWTF